MCAFFKVHTCIHRCWLCACWVLCSVGFSGRLVMVPENGSNVFL